MKKVITISREFGSGGREVGLRIAKELYIPFYDKELVHLAAEKGGVAPKIIEAYEESVVRGRLFTPRPALFGFYGQSLPDQIYLKQFHLILELANQGPCVIVGRCTDYILTMNILPIRFGAKRRTIICVSALHRSARMVQLIWCCAA